MEGYLLNSAACLLVFYVFYKALLENSSLHRFKRYYLLGGLLASLLIPLITFTNYVEIPSLEESLLATSMPIESTGVILEEKINYIPYLLWSIYGVGVLIFSIRFYLNLHHIVRKMYRNPKFGQNRLYHVLLTESIIPHTFFNHIFFNKERYNAGAIPKEVFWHEETHARQLHSIDVILLELLQIVLWFNPLLYFIKKAIKLNHEFLADQSVLNQSVPAKHYQQLVLAFSSNVQTPSMAHSINYSSIKKRFTVMKHQTSQRAMWVRTLLVIPLVSIVLYSFSSTKTVTTFSDSAIEVQQINASDRNSEKIVSEEKVTPEQLTAYNKMASYWNARFEANPEDRTMPLSELKKLETIYRLMSPLQKNEAQPFPECTPPLQEGYTQQYLNGAARNHKKAFVLMITLDEIMLNGRTSSLETLTEDMDALTENWSKTDHENAHPSILIASSSSEFIDKANNAFKKSVFSKTTAMELQAKIPVFEPLQQKATPEQLAEYNTLARKYNAMDPNNMTVYKRDIDRLTYLYGLMSVAQRKNAAPYPNFPKLPKEPVPPMPPAPASEPTAVVPPAPPHAPESPLITVYKTENLSISEIEKGLRNLNQKETTYYINDKVVTLEKAIDFVGKTKKYDFFVSESKDKQIGAYLTTGKNNSNKMVLPPPPPPPAPVSTDPLDHIVRMAKENAAFLYQNKRISSDKAIELIKENRNLNISTQTFNNSNPIVNISKKGIKLEE
ncbi:M56 family metallopeptidase [Cochleicola gelatinilyticus]|uniref:Peptidase M56 domain-containing protein n=1 Tax=Cochleicola gelatinilyticus TaxID=1763537 RepID=A0A167IQ97_9FLAO|nr:M56 family metallopeptidase [Cochleicola gelatinilyticus]OAB79905.1 hypothetical protein ULVI_03970 [Cochleicola gelatinilyticus]